MKIRTPEDLDSLKNNDTEYDDNKMRKSESLVPRRRFTEQPVRYQDRGSQITQYDKEEDESFPAERVDVPIDWKDSPETNYTVSDSSPKDLPARRRETRDYNRLVELDFMREDYFEEQSRRIQRSVRDATDRILTEVQEMYSDFYKGFSEQSRIPVESRLASSEPPQPQTYHSQESYRQPRFPQQHDVESSGLTPLGVQPLEVVFETGDGQRYFANIKDAVLDNIRVWKDDNTNTLTVQVEKGDYKEQRGSNYQYVEISRSRETKSYKLPPGVGPIKAYTDKKTNRLVIVAEKGNSFE